MNIGSDIVISSYRTLTRISDKIVLIVLAQLLTQALNQILVSADSNDRIKTNIRSDFVIG